MGWRSIRLTLDRPFLLRQQLRALIRATAGVELRVHQRTAELELRILSQRNAYVQAAADELKDTSARIFDLEERIRPSKDAAARQKIESAGGVVVLLDAGTS